MSKVFSAREEVLLAALNLTNSGKEVFTEWDLTVSAWELNKNRWGLPGYSELYPDHKRVMNEVMAKGDMRLLSLGLVMRVDTNRYKLTPAGHMKANGLIGTHDNREKANIQLFDILSKYLASEAFAQYLNDKTKPKIWLHVASFFGLSASMTAQRAYSRINEFLLCVNQAEKTITELGEESIRRTSKGQHLTKKDIQNLHEFYDEMRTRFKAQFDALLGEE